MTGRAATVAWFLAAAASLTAIPLAHADELSYLQRLDSQGVPYGTGATWAIKLGRSICVTLRAADDVADAVMETARAGMSSGFSQHEAGVVIGAAVGELCPDQEARIRRYLQRPESAPFVSHFTVT